MPEDTACSQRVLHSHVSRCRPKLPLRENGTKHWSKQKEFRLWLNMSKRETSLPKTFPKRIRVKACGESKFKRMRVVSPRWHQGNKIRLSLDTPDGPIDRRRRGSWVCSDVRSVGLLSDIEHHLLITCSSEWTKVCPKGNRCFRNDAKALGMGNMSNEIGADFP